MNDSSIAKLADALHAYKIAYYSGSPLVPDAVYDALEDDLRRLAPSHPVLSMVGPGGMAQAKVNHSPKMLSLQKTYDAKNVVEFARKHPLIKTPKADGVAMKLIYTATTDGRALLTQASSRGNGEWGEDYTASVILTKVPKEILMAAAPTAASVEVRGELVFPRSHFAHYAERYDSPRNAVAGQLGLKIPDRLALAGLEFFGYEIFFYDTFGKVLQVASTYGETLTLMAQSGIKTFPAVRLDASSDVSGMVDKFFSEDSSRDFDTDGIVFRVDDIATWESLGSTSHHPNGSLAFKREGETAETTIESIEVATGRTGKISFTAILTPVFLSGASLGRATLHNAAFIEEGSFAPTAKIEIVRSGEVIPYVKALKSPPITPYALPSDCPSCLAPLERRGPDLFCTSTECPAREESYALYFLQTLEVKGIAAATVEALYTAGLVNTVADFFRLTTDDFLKLDGYKTKSAQNAYEAIQKCRAVGLDKFLSVLGIPGVGRTKGKELANIIKTKDKIFSLTAKDLETVNGWGEKTISALIGGLSLRNALIKDLLSVMTVLDIDDSLPTGGPLSGEVLVITGKLSLPRKEFEKILTAAGARLADSVSKETTILICDAPSDSSKYKKAVSLGTPILTEDDILKRIGG